MSQKMMTTVFSKRMNNVPQRLFLLIFLSASFLPSAMAQLHGAWTSSDLTETRTIIYAGKTFSCAVYQVKDRKFSGTYGGTYTIEGNAINEIQEYNTFDVSPIGVITKTVFRLHQNELVLITGGKEITFQKLDDGRPGKLAGAWLITGRMVDGKVSSITPGARRTMKILSGTRFQWIAYNTETKEFFGTGGGIYETTQNRYTETIEFFSRDNSRVGAMLSFDFSIDGGKWHHSGLSSKGDPINEYWSLREDIGF